MQLMQNFLLRLNVFPPFNGPMERRLAIYTTLAPVETFTSPWVCWFIYHTPNVYSCQLVIHVAFVLHNQVVLYYERQSPSCGGDFHQQEP